MPSLIRLIHALVVKLVDVYYESKESPGLNPEVIFFAILYDNLKNVD